VASNLMVRLPPNKILIVEDDLFLLEIYAHKFSDANFEIVTALDGESALEVIRKEKPDVILLDLILPKIDGLEVLRLIKKDKEFSSIPVIILTNRGEKDLIEKAIKLGAAAFITKITYTPTEVVSKVKSIVEKVAAQSKK